MDRGLAADSCIIHCDSVGILMTNCIPDLIRDKIKVYQGWKVATVDFRQLSCSNSIVNDQKNHNSILTPRNQDSKNSSCPAENLKNTLNRASEAKTKDDVNKQLIELYKSEKFKKIQKMILETQEYAEMVTRENAILRAKVESGKPSNCNGASVLDLNFSSLTEEQLDTWTQVYSNGLREISAEKGKREAFNEYKKFQHEFSKIYSLNNILQSRINEIKNCLYTNESLDLSREINEPVVSNEKTKTDKSNIYSEENLNTPKSIVTKTNPQPKTNPNKNNKETFIEFIEEEKEQPNELQTNKNKPIDKVEEKDSTDSINFSIESAVANKEVGFKMKESSKHETQIKKSRYNNDDNEVDDQESIVSLSEKCSNEDPYHSNQLSDLKVCKTERKEFNQRPINYYQIDDEDKIMAGQSTKFLNKYNTHNDFESVNPLETPQVEEKVVQMVISSQEEMIQPSSFK